MKPLILGLCLASIFGLFAWLPRAAAQEGQFRIVIATCLGPATDCKAATGISFTVTDAATGAELGSCVSNFEPPSMGTGCEVDVEVNDKVIVTEDVSTLPAGYIPTQNPISAVPPSDGGPAVVGSYHVRPAEAPGGEAPPSQLPSTGVGSTANRSATAQDDTIELSIAKIDCPSLPAEDEFPFENWQHECEPGIGVNFLVADASTGLVIGTCATDVFHAPEPQAAAFCAVSVQLGLTVIVTEDTKTATSGYAPVQESVTVTIPDQLPPSGEGPQARFINVLQTQLPSTGSGSAALYHSLIPW